ncbi:MAG: hypothetical protein LBE35_08580 [Clostridiales bacterium]|jgi:hypothetical protein|nr:hypothetical protein [Clostridiales bacterium]
MVEQNKKLALSKKKWYYIHMKYCLCVKENSKNLLHIIKAEDLEKPFLSGFVQVATADDEGEAIDAAARLIEDFCQIFWNEGESPDFSGFKAWLRGKL